MPEQPLQGMELKEKEAQRDPGSLSRKSLQLKDVSLILQLKPFRS